VDGGRYFDLAATDVEHASVVGGGSTLALSRESNEYSVHFDYNTECFAAAAGDACWLLSNSFRHFCYDRGVHAETSNLLLLRNRTYALLPIFDYPPLLFLVRFC